MVIDLIARYILSLHKIIILLPLNVRQEFFINVEHELSHDQNGMIVRLFVYTNFNENILS